MLFQTIQHFTSPFLTQGSNFFNKMYYMLYKIETEYTPVYKFLQVLCFVPNSRLLHF